MNKSLKLGKIRKNQSGIIVPIIAAIIAFTIYFLVFNVALPTTVDTGQVEDDIFEMINHERANRGLPELNFDSNLETIAKNWSEELLNVGELTHGNFEQRIASIGYSFYFCGEIIAEQSGWSSSLARDFVDGWINSPPHYEIMKTASQGYMGVGVSKNGDLFYAVVDFRFS